VPKTVGPMFDESEEAGHRSPGKNAVVFFAPRHAIFSEL